MKHHVLFLFAIFMVALSFASAHNKHHACVHDRISEEFQPMTEPQTVGRILLNGIEEEKKPLRVKFDTSGKLIQILFY